jgi:hypothetical protein
VHFQKPLPSLHDSRLVQPWRARLRGSVAGTVAAYFHRHSARLHVQRIELRPTELDVERDRSLAMDNSVLALGAADRHDSASCRPST